MIEMGKTYETDIGAIVSIHTVNGMDKEFPVVGEYRFRLQDPVMMRWTLNGDPDERIGYCRLIEVKQKHKRTVWINIYPNCLCLHEHEENAKSQLSTDRIACVEVPFEYEEGQGL